MSNPRAAQLVEAGMWLRLSGDHEGAKRLFDQALKLDPDNARARQLIDGGPPSAPPPPPQPPTAPSPPHDNPFAPAPTSTAMDLDWGSATGFAPTPVPFIPPVEFRSLPPVDQPEAELPIELEVESVAPPVFGDESPAGTLVFGLGDEVPPPAPTVPERWADAQPSSPTMLFHDSTPPMSEAEHLPWGGPAEPMGSTMQFARPVSLTPLPPGPAAGSQGGTMQFARPQDPPAPASSGTMQFGRPKEQSGNTMQFAQPGEVTRSLAGGTMEFAQPNPALQAEDSWGELSGPPAVFSPPARPSEPKFTSDATSAWDQRSNPGIKLDEIRPGVSAALDLVSSDRPPASPPVVKSKLDEVRTLMRGAKDLLNLDDHTGAMDLILKAQELAPNDPEVQALRTRSESTLEAMFESKLGALTKAPRVKLKDDEIIWLNLDHRAGFVLAQIDGQVTFDDLFSVSGMSRLDTARILAQLIEEGVITS